MKDLGVGVDAVNVKMGRANGVISYHSFLCSQTQRMPNLAVTNVIKVIPSFKPGTVLKVGRS